MSSCIRSEMIVDPMTVSAGLECLSDIVAAKDYSSRQEYARGKLFLVVYVSRPQLGDE